LPQTLRACTERLYDVWHCTTHTAYTMARGTHNLQLSIMMWHSSACVRL
jgi:hypothetical protein